jgi:hypothetical protein
MTVGPQVFPFPPGGMAGVMAQQVQLQLQQWQSPYPPPQHVREYEAILPGTLDRIVKMVEAGQQAQIDTVATAQAHTHADSRRGNYLGFATTVIAMGCAVWCAKLGQPWVAGLLLSVPVMSVAKALIEGTRRGRPTAAAPAPQTSPSSQPAA